MGVLAGWDNEDEVFANLTHKPIIANDIPLNTKEEKAEFNKLLLNEFDGDSLSVIPRCDCGKYRDGFNLNKICDVCYSPVTFITEKPIYSNVWIKAPDGIKALISPLIWTQLRSYFKYKNGKVNIIDWLCNRGYVIRGTVYPDELLNVMELVKHGVIKRGLNYFVENFDHVMEVLFVPNIAKVQGRKRLRTRDYFIRANAAGVVFSQHLPIPSKVTMVTEKNSYGKFVDDLLLEPVNAVTTISGIKFGVGPKLKPIQIESRTIKAITQLAEYHWDNFSKRYASKPGLFRKHIYSSRLDWTGRAVITSLTCRHDYDELHIPWAMAMSIFDIHIFGKLIKRGFSDRRARALIQDYTSRYHPLLEEIHNELINEVSFCKGIPVLFMRNPALARGSSQCLRITIIKKDTSDKTISFPIQIVSAPNADFDGDEMNLCIIPDKWMYERCKALRPSNYFMHLSKPLTVSQFINMSAPVLSNTAHWLNSNY